MDFIKIWNDEEAVHFGEMFGLSLVKNYPDVGHTLPKIYTHCAHEFNKSSGVVFSINTKTNSVHHHTCFSNMVTNAILHFNLRNIPLRSIENGTGSTTLAAIFFALYAALLYVRIE